MRSKVVIVLIAVLACSLFYNQAFSSGFAAGPSTSALAYINDSGQAFITGSGGEWTYVGTYPDAVGISFISVHEWIIALSDGKIQFLHGAFHSNLINPPAGLTGTVLGVTTFQNYNDAELSEIGIWTSTGELWYHSLGGWNSIPPPSTLIGTEPSTLGKIKLIEK
jgi:hypothetical protein